MKDYAWNPPRSTKAKPAYWANVPKPNEASSAWFAIARHDVGLAIVWDRRALGILQRERRRRDYLERSLELARRGEECWVGAVVALLRALS